MKKVKKEKGYLAVGLLLSVILTIVAFRFSHLYAANQVEVSKKCSLTLQLPDNSEYCTELENVSLEAKVYRIASIDENGVCASVSGYESLDLEKYGQDSKNWKEIMKKAETIAKGKTADAEITVEHGQGTTGDLKTGLYLVMVEDAVTDLHEYHFSSALVMLPNNLYLQTGKVEDDSWYYDVICNLKPEQNPRYGAIKICKTLKSYNTALGDVSFVFQIEGVDAEGNTVYSNVVSTTHDEAGTKEVLVEHIPAGTTVTVTEVYSGASYRLETEPEKTVVIAADDFVTVEFTNTYDEELVPGYGVTNHFEYSEDEGWQWSQLRDNSIDNK